MFVKTKHNQRYHSAECLRKATNKKIMKHYYERKARMAGHRRLCSECLSDLSRYNESTICEACKTAKRIAETRRLLKEFG